VFALRKEVDVTPKKRLNILLADDGSQHAQSAVELLQDIPLPPKSSIVVLRAFSPGQIDLLPEFERSLERSRDQLASKGFEVETELKLGSAAALILEKSESQKLDLIVLGAKGLRSTVSILLGGVAQQVMEYATCPVLIVRAPYRGFRKILLATDGSPSSVSAAHYLGRFPLPEGIKLHVLHVLPPAQMPVMMEPYAGAWHTVYALTPAPEVEEARVKMETKHGEALLARTCRPFQRNGVETAPVLARGDAATEIMHYTQTNQLNLIVAGSLGMSNLRSLWVGSVSRKLVHYSDCSVLIVKGPKEE
jgi:nucleotide-binding universal stress UspA family protein